MQILERIDGYIEEIKRTPYVYKLQKAGIEIFKDYILSNGLDIREEDFHKALLDKLILIWLPRNKKYLDEAQAYQIVYTIYDLARYIYKQSGVVGEEEIIEDNTLLQIYGEEYMRIYKAKGLLQQMTSDPVISIDPMIIDLDRYRSRKKKGSYSDIATTYEQALFEIAECRAAGQIVLHKVGQTKQYKLLLEYPAYKYLKKGDILQAVIKRKLFYVYWEMEEIKACYLPQAIPFLHLS